MKWSEDANWQYKSQKRSIKSVLFLVLFLFFVVHSLRAVAISTYFFKLKEIGMLRSTVTMAKTTSREKTICWI